MDELVARDFDRLAIVGANEENRTFGLPQHGSTGTVQSLADERRSLLSLRDAVKLAFAAKNRALLSNPSMPRMHVEAYSNRMMTRNLPLDIEARQLDQASADVLGTQLAGRP